MLELCKHRARSPPNPSTKDCVLPLELQVLSGVTSFKSAFEAIAFISGIVCVVVLLLLLLLLLLLWLVSSVLFLFRHGGSALLFVQRRVLVRV